MSDVVIRKGSNAVVQNSGDQVAVVVDKPGMVPAAVSAGQAASSAAAALADRLLADADVTATHGDAAATAADRVATGADRTAVAADRAAADADKVATAADRVATSNSAALAAASEGNADGYATAAADDLTAVQAERAGVEAAIAGAGGSLGTVTLEAADKDVLAALDTSLGLSARVTHEKHGGPFNWVEPAPAEVAAFQADVAADTGRMRYVAPAASTGKATDGSDGYWTRDEFDGFLRPEWADGFVGDGVASDQAAFTHMHNLAARLGYLRVRLTAGRTYMGGDQAPDGTYYQNSIHAINANSGSGITSLIIEGNGATLKTNPGLKYGTFDPVTGNPIVGFSTDPAKTARAPTMINASGCDLVRIDDIILDGNPTAFIIGGGTNTSNLEARHYGIHLDACKRWKVTNFKITGFLQDGVVTTDVGAVETDNATAKTLSNGVIDGAGRCCLALLGGFNFRIDNVHMLNPGAPLVWTLGGPGSHGTSPKVPCDIEAEGPLGRIKFTRCSFQQGQYGANSITSGSATTRRVLFDQCQFVGMHLPASPRMKFHKCDFFGPFTQLYTNTNAEDAMVFDECFLTDATFNDTPMQTAGGNLYFGTGGSGVRYKNCIIDVSRHRVQAGSASISSGRNVWTFRFGTETFPGGTAAFQLGSGFASGVKLVEAITANAPASGYTVTANNDATILDCEIVTPNNKLFWLDNTVGFAGKFNSVRGNRGITTYGAVSVTLDAMLSTDTVLFDGAALTADKNCKMPAPVAGLDREFLVVRGPNCTGLGFNLNCQTNSGTLLRALGGPNTFARLRSAKGAEYQLIESGRLQDLSSTIVGYDVGAGSTAVQGTSKSTAFAINRVTGQFTTHAANLAAGANVTFQVNDNKVLATDFIGLNLASGNATPGSYDYRISGVGAGFFKVTLENRSGGTLGEALVFNYVVIRGQNS